MFLTAWTFSLFALGITAIPHPNEKRAIKDDMTIYAYGEGISGLPVLATPYGNAGLSSANATSMSTITSDISTIGSTSWNVTSPTNTTITSSTFYIITTSDAFSPIGFVPSNETAPTGAETDGFALYGSDVAYISNDIYLSQFWAKTVGCSEYEIYWNVNGSDQADSVPVTLKITAPTLPSS